MALDEQHEQESRDGLKRLWRSLAIWSNLSMHASNFVTLQPS